MDFPKGFKPLLAINADLDKIKFPCQVSPKLDGIRCIVRDGVAYSRNLKPLPNLYMQKKIKEMQVNDHDGEILVGDPTNADAFRQAMHGIMSEDEEPDFVFWAFDLITEELKDKPYSERYELINLNNRVESPIVNNMEELNSLEERWTSMGYEGLMVRSLNGRYKYGRSSVNEGILLKVKRFVDDEATIIGFQEGQHNANEATTDLLGHTERSSHKENKIPKGMLGSLICLTSEGKEFRLGTGFKEAERIHIWNNKESYLGKLAKFRYQPCGMKDLPRFPSYLGIRERIDL